MLLTISYSESAYPITPVKLLKAILYDYFGISVYSVYSIFIYNIKFTYDKNCEIQIQHTRYVLVKFYCLGKHHRLFTFLINTADKEIRPYTVKHDTKQSNDEYVS